MKQSFGTAAFFTGTPIPGFFYGVGDAALDPGQGVDRLLAEAAGVTSPGRAKQVHGDGIVLAPEAIGSCEADAIVARAGEAAVIRVADCVPIILIQPQKRIAAAVHAGWRGTFARIVEKTAARLGPGETFAYIGPAVGGCCYEVGDELAAKFAAEFGEGSWIRREFSAPHLDLQALNAHLLAKVGARVEVEHRCTVESSDLHSFRRDGERAGRLAAFVAVA